MTTPTRSRTSRPGTSSRRLVARLRAALGERYGAPGRGRSAAVAAVRRPRYCPRIIGYSWHPPPALRGRLKRLSTAWYLARKSDIASRTTGCRERRYLRGLVGQALRRLRHDRRLTSCAPARLEPLDSGISTTRARRGAISCAFLSPSRSIFRLLEPSGAKEGENRKDSAVRLGGLVKAEFEDNRGDVCLDGAVGDVQPLADRAVVKPSGTRASTVDGRPNWRGRTPDTARRTGPHEQVINFHHLGRYRQRLRRQQRLPLRGLIA